MNATENFPWIPFYMNFADALVPYRNRRHELIQKLLAVFSAIDMKFPTLERGGLPEDIDPFTVFALFNKNNTNDKRQALIRGLKAEFGVAGQVPADFPGIPTADPRSVAFYGFRGERAENDIENLWGLFSAALELASEDTPQRRDRFCAAFDQALTQKQVKWNITMGLFWIRPYAFLNLDSRNRDFLKLHLQEVPFLEKEPRTLFKNVPAGHTYLAWCDAFRELFSSGSAPWSSFPELSLDAWLFVTSKEPEKTEKPVPAPAPTPPDIPAEPQIPGPPSYTREDFLKQTFLEPDEYDALAETLEHKKNLILQGPPGVGKTYIARRLAWALAGAKDAERVRLVQFHQNTSYEDFIMGFRPVENGFKLKEGIFPAFCQQAAQDKRHNYYLIIDEINRGNTSKIFGDMFMLLEKDKRGEENGIPLLYKPEEKFSIPENLFLIGTMNTADRSLAMLDYALRRRFAFYDLEPAFGSAKFGAYEQELKNAAFTALVSTVEEVNHAIADDPALGDGFRIGHSYFSNFTPETLTPAKLRSLVEHELIPLLREYWFDEREKAQTWAGRLRACLK
ncbi:MAG: AAA family ATPase [Desulfovibrio sp.]|nr:AAA family ATPase [Desulfovibrio sp.]